MTLEEIGKKILNCSFTVHKALGPGLLEKVYLTCLAMELKAAGLKIEVEKPIPVAYKGIEFECGYRADILVEGKIIIELKAVNNLADVHMAQTLTYMRMTGCELGYLLNFNTKLLKEGIKRLVL
ncbi:MAG: GxxExxY protein [Bacteroidetes bacterium HGW-Bacteroidetes-6]|jgi:GxxExxY protein|nr:MAG: GxxExxY protein [Bacteroidetes bacterium HGW-Bacteroidetes-6]